MTPAAQNAPTAASGSPLKPFRRAVLRGLGTLLPPLITVVFFIWAGKTIDSYVLDPLKAVAREGLVWCVSDVRRDLEGEHAESGGVEYTRMHDDTYAPTAVLTEVRTAGNTVPLTSTELYRRYVDVRYLRPQYVVPIFLCLFILILYLVGKFLAIGLGRFFWNLFEGIVQRLPLVRSVYGAVKQVTDFVFSDNELQFTRIVAVEYPRKGLWQLAFVTGEGLPDVQDATGEPMVSVLLPASPMPMTGFAAVVRKSETIDLNITFDQAIQFLVSCGVVTPKRLGHLPGALPGATIHDEDAERLEA